MCTRPEQVYSGRDIYQSWAQGELPKTAGVEVAMGKQSRAGVREILYGCAARARNLGKNGADLQKNARPPNKYFSTLFP